MTRDPPANQEEKSMPRTISQEPATDDLKKLFEYIFPDIPTVVRKVCVNLGRDPDRMDVDEFAQRIRVLLWKNDYRVLRLFKHESSLETWLFTIAERKILRWLREQGCIKDLEDKAPDSFIVQQDQEERLLRKERRKILQSASFKLPRREQKLLGLWRQEWSREETAEEMGIRKESGALEKVDLIKMLQRIIREDYAI